MIKNILYIHVIYTERNLFCISIFGSFFQIFMYVIYVLLKRKKKKPNKSICIYNVRATHLASDRILTYIHLRARILTPHCDDHHFHFQLIGGVCATLCYIKTHIYINPYGGVWVYVCVCACYWRQISYYDAERCGAFKLL